MLSSLSSTFESCVGLFTVQYFCGARRIRAPFAPPRLSEPRKVDADVGVGHADRVADAHAVDTSSDTVKPDESSLAFSDAMSLSSISL